MNIKRLLSRLPKHDGCLYIKGACGYLSLELNPKTADEASRADHSKMMASAAHNDGPRPPASAQVTSEGLSEAEISLLSRFSTLSEEDKSALMRFISYAAKSDELGSDDETPDAGVDTVIAGWLDEQARLHTEN